MPNKKPSPKSATPKPKSPTSPRPGDPKPKSTAAATKRKPIGRVAKAEPRTPIKTGYLDYNRFAGRNVDGEGAYGIEQNIRAMNMMDAEAARRKARREAGKAAAGAASMQTRGKGMAQQAMNKKRGQRSGNG
jgi:hypothetical protein